MSLVLAFFVSLQFTAAGVVQVNVSAQLVPVRAVTPNGRKSATGSRRASLEVPTGSLSSASGDGSPGSSGSPGSAVKTPPSDTEWEIKVEVIDQGIGISDTEIGSLFQSFRQAKKVQMTFGGTGLGLAISRSVEHGTSAS